MHLWARFSRRRKEGGGEEREEERGWMERGEGDGWMNGSTYLAWESGISKGDKGSSESDSLLLSEVSTCWERGYSSRLSGRGTGTSITATQQERGGGRGRKESPLKPRLSWPYQYCCSHALVDPNYHIVLLHPLHLFTLLLHSPLHPSTPPPSPPPLLHLHPLHPSTLHLHPLHPSTSPSYLAWTGP